MLLPALASQFDTSEQVVAGPFSTAIAVFAVSVVVSGRTVDRVGPRRTCTAAGALSGLGLAATALAQHVLVLHLGFGVLFGAGSGLAYSSVVTWASTRTGPGTTRSVGLVVAAYAAGPVVAGPLAGLSSALWGWRVTVLLSAVAVATVTALASRALPHTVVGPRARSGHGARGTDLPALAALWLLFLSASAPGLFAFAYAADLAAQRGLDPQLGGLAVAAMGTGNLAGRLAADPLLSRVDLRTALRIDLSIMVLALAALASLSGRAAAVLTLALVAVQYGAVSALLPTAVGRVCDAHRFGSRYGLVFSSWGLAGVLASRLPDPVAADGAALRSWLALTAAAAVGLAVYEGRLTRQPA